jgi:hypothetical protein
VLQVVEVLALDLHEGDRNRRAAGFGLVGHVRP